MEKAGALLKKLGYDPRWLEYGFLTLDTLSSQAVALEQDPNPEHHRYGSFMALLANKEVLPDDLIAKYLELVDLDPDQTMAGSAAGSLLRQRGLTEKQFAVLCDRFASWEPWMQRLINRIKLLRLLEQPQLTEDQLMFCATEGDSQVQRKLLERADLIKAVLDRLYSQGTNQAVRNMAMRRLGIKKRKAQGAGASNNA